MTRALLSVRFRAMLAAFTAQARQKKKKSKGMMVLDPNVTTDATTAPSPASAARCAAAIWPTAWPRPAGWPVRA